MASADDIRNLFPVMVERFIPEKANGIAATIVFDLSGDNGGMFWMRIEAGAVSGGEGGAADPAMTLRASADDWYAVATGELNPMTAFMTGRVKIDGDMSLAMKLQTMFAN